MKRFMRTVIHTFAPSFVEIVKVEVSKPVRGINDEKGVVFSPSPGLLEQTRQKIYGVTVSPFPVPLSHFVKICPV